MNMKAIVTVFGSLFLTCVCLAETPAASTHKWQRIVYPNLPCPWGAPQGMAVWLSPSEWNRELRLDLVLTGPGIGKESPPTPKEGDIEVGLHIANNKVIRPRHSLLEVVVWIGGSFGTSGDMMCFFPWQENKLQEAWIEVKLPGRTYWLEIPYGFTRDPRQPLPAFEPNRDSPSLAQAMANLKQDDRIVPWGYVEYDFGEIQNKWRLSVQQSNPFDAQCEVILYRDDLEVGKSKYLWDLHSPRTSVEIEDPHAHPLKSTCMSIRRHEGGMRRSDSFKFNCYPVSGRSYGTLTVKVGDKAYSAKVPSSLYKSTHGTAQPNHKQRLPTETK